MSRKFPLCALAMWAWSADCWQVGIWYVMCFMPGVKRFTWGDLVIGMESELGAIIQKPLLPFRAQGKQEAFQHSRWSRDNRNNSHCLILHKAGRYLDKQDKIYERIYNGWSTNLGGISDIISKWNPSYWSLSLLTGVGLSWPEPVFTSRILTKAQTVAISAWESYTGALAHDWLVHEALVPTEHQLNIRYRV